MQYNKYYQIGFDAYYDGVPLSQNPYPSASYFHDAWEDGWIDAEDEKLHPMAGMVKEGEE